MKWIKDEAERKVLKTPLTFTAEEAGSTIRMVNTFPTSVNIYLETSPTGEDGSWSDFFVFDTTITLPNIGDKVYFRAKTDNNTFYYGEGSFQFEMTGKIAASGNLNTLLKADGSVLDLTGRDYCFSGMFYCCDSLTQAPSLPATTLAQSCYSNMFAYCTSLTQAPALPATTLAEECYLGMFRNCSSMNQIPELSAPITIPDVCYINMFYNCKSPITFINKASDEIINLIKNYLLIGEWFWDNYDKIEINCSDKILIVTFDWDNYEWIITEK